MFLMLFFIAAILLLLAASLKNTFSEYGDAGNAFGQAFLAFMVFAVCIATPIGASYGQYVTLQTHYQTIVENYRESVEYYEDKAVIDVNGLAFTDFKYQGYQDNMANMIRDLRRNVTNYNAILIQKRTLKQSKIFNWYIILPEDNFKIISLTG